MKEESDVLQAVSETEILNNVINIYGSIDNPLFLASDVAEWIDYSYANGGKTSRQTSKMLKGVDEEDKCLKILGCNNITTHGGLRKNTQMWFVTEDGLYEICMQSRKPIAKKMKKEIKEYLHNIRTTGGAVELGREEEFIEHYFPSFREEVKLAMVQDLRTQNEELKVANEQLKSDNLALSGDILSWTDRKKLNAGVRKLASVMHVQFGSVWSELYKQLHYKYGINLKARNGGQRPYIENVKESEWNMVVKSFAAICESYDQSPTDMFQQKVAIS